jgi:hypothetical protein
MGSYAEFAAEVQVRKHLAETGCDCEPDVVLVSAGERDLLCEVEHAASCKTIACATSGDVSLSELVVGR